MNITANVEITDAKIGQTFTLTNGDTYIIEDINDFSHNPDLQSFMHKRGTIASLTIRKPKGKIIFSAQLTNLRNQSELTGTIWNNEITKG